ncbi:MAG: GNAT family N-acetyltransferase [Caldilineaceae bacterium]|nr:GNAT family N-acetyltransferase [Caldilineaceae bacterium]
MSDQRLTTDRLYARQFTPADLDEFAALCADATVLRYVGDGTTLPRADVARWIEICQQKYASRGYGTSAVFERESDRFIGYCGVVRAPENDFDELIYVYHQAAWGKGYATEMGRAMLDYVFSVSALDKIYATIQKDNQASQLVAQKLGMRLEKAESEEDGVVVLYYVIDRPG